MTKEEELGLAQKAREGDLSAFETIVGAYEKILYNVALRSLRSPEDAADAVQETFLKAYTGLSGFRGDSKLSVWLYRILQNVCVDALRKRRETVSLSQGQTADGFEEEIEIPDERFDPAAVVQRSDLGERVRAALERLPAEFRMPLLLREYADLSYVEIAEALSLDVGTVKTRIFRARKKLCILLADDGNFSKPSPSKSTEGGVRA